MKYSILSIFVSIIVVNAQKKSPLKAEIFKDNSQSFFVGPGERVSFGLDRPFQPLSPASSVLTDDSVNGVNPVFNPEYKPRILATKNTVTMLAHPSFETVQPTQTEGKIDITAPKIKPIENYNGSRWLSWSQWSQCVNGERTRIRACLRMGLEPCFGSNVMVEKCLASANVPIAMAHDPWSIEKEISQRSK